MTISCSICTFFDLRRNKDLCWISHVCQYSEQPFCRNTEQSSQRTFEIFPRSVQNTPERALRSTRTRSVRRALAVRPVGALSQIPITGKRLPTGENRQQPCVFFDRERNAPSRHAENDSLYKGAPERAVRLGIGEDDPDPRPVVTGIRRAADTESFVGGGIRVVRMEETAPALLAAVAFIRWRGSGSSKDRQKVQERMEFCFSLYVRTFFF